MAAHPELQRARQLAPAPAAGGRCAHVGQLVHAQGVDVLLLQGGQQVAVAGVDNTLYGQLCSPALTTLDNRLAEVSQTAATLLLDLLLGKEVPHRQVLPAAVIVREST